MKTGGAALEEVAVVRKDTKNTNPTAKFSLRRRKARMWLLTLGSVPGSMADLVISMGSFVDLDLNDSIPSGSAFVPTNADMVIS
jgi:hypothetical protein